MSSLVPYSWTNAIVGANNARPGMLSDSLLTQRRTEIQHLAQFSIDNSYSTYRSGANKEIEKCLPEMLSQLQSDWSIRSALLGAFAVFDDKESWRYDGPFGPVTEMRVPRLVPTSSTPLCTRIIESIHKLIANRKLVRNVLHAEQRHAWCIEITDGQPTDFERASEAARAIRETAVENGIEVHLFGMGEDADMQFLHSIAQPQRPAIALDEFDYRKIFEWLVSSLKITSQSLKGEKTFIRSVTGQLIPTE